MTAVALRTVVLTSGARAAAGAGARRVAPLRGDHPRLNDGHRLSRNFATGAPPCRALHIDPRDTGDSADLPAGASRVEAWIDDLTRAAYRRRLGVYAREMELGHAWPFFIFDAQGRSLMGAITLSNVRRGVAETGTLGYWVGQPFAGRGVATAAVKAMTGFAFRSARLHRLEASCLPTNLGSRRVLEKAGFVKEGEARAYLKINGAWADHVLFGLVADDVAVS
eukprot:gene58783-80511_t